MRRREFISLLGGAAVTWPLVARAERALPVVGYLHSGAAAPFAHLVAVFRQALRDSGFVEGQNLAIEYRWANGEYDRLPTLALDLVQRQVAVIVTAGGSVSGLAAKKATASIPIVFTSGDDPVRVGLVSNLNHPRANITGVYVVIGVLDAKKLGLLREIAPKAAVIAALENSMGPSIQERVSMVEKAARAIGHQVQVYYASDQRTLETTFAQMSQSGVGALVVGADPFFNSRREQIVTLAAQYAIPAIYETRDYVVAGGLMSYGTDLSEGYRQVGIYTGRILKGDKPGELPVVQSSKFELVINMKAANALGLAVPISMQLLADEVIE
jgi:putative tryptophan/tyrosine transport system substrate-binding protein